MGRFSAASFALLFPQRFPMLALDYSSTHMCSKVYRLAFMLAALCTPSLGQDSFMMHFTPAGAGASIVNRGDFNNDGIPDIITGNNWGSSGNAVSVYLGIGDGRFKKNKDSGTGEASFDIASGDFNGDSKLDVAVAGYGSSTGGVLQILLGKGDGTFTFGQRLNLSTTPDAVTTTDFNGDGKLDLAIVSDKVYFYEGAWNGTFSMAASIPVGTKYVRVRLATSSLSSSLLWPAAKSIPATGRCAASRRIWRRLRSTA